MDGLIRTKYICIYTRTYSYLCAAEGSIVHDVVGQLVTPVLIQCSQSVVVTEVEGVGHLDQGLGFTVSYLYVYIYVLKRCP